MAEEKILKTRVILKNATYAEWEASTIVLKKGEVALVSFETASDKVPGATVPTYLMKVGDGESTFAELNWFHAPASDVHAWAKKAKITDNTEIAAVIAESAQNKADIEAEINRATSVEGGFETRITDLETAVGTGGSVAEAIKAAIEALDVTDAAVEKQFVTAVAEADGKISVTRRALTADDIPTLAIDKIDGLQTALNAKATTEYVDDQIAAVDGKVTAEANARSSADTALGNRITELETFKNTTVPATYETIAKVDLVRSNVAANSTAITALQGRMTEAEGDITNLQDNKADKANTLAGYGIGDAYTKNETDTQISNAVKGILGDDVSEAYDTLVEIQKLMEADDEASTALVAKVNANETAINNEVGRAEAAEEALDTRLTAAEGKITTLQGSNHTHSNKTELDKIADGDKEKWDEAYAKRHEHSNKTVLDGITSAKVTAWDAAQQNAIDHADGLNNTMSSRVKAIEDDYLKAADKTALQNSINEKATKATTLAGYGITDAYTKAETDAAIDADVAAARTAITTAYEAADTALDSRISTLENKKLVEYDNDPAQVVYVFDCGTHNTVI